MSNNQCSKILETFHLLVKSSLEAINPAELVANCLKFELDNFSKNIYMNVKNILSSDMCNKTFEKKVLVDHNIYVLAFGKAALGMMTSVENMIGKTHVIEGIAIVPYNDAIKFLELNPQSKDQFDQSSNQFYPFDNSRINYYYGAKSNLPDLNSLKAANKAFEMCEKLKENDILLTLISGGGSALLSLPADIASQDNIKNLDIKLKTIKAIVNSGANINELNSVRSCLSKLKAGKLSALSYPSKVVSLIISDVINDPFEIIASGPTITRLLQSNTLLKNKALNIIDKYNLREIIPRESIFYLERQIKEDYIENETQTWNFLIGNNSLATNSIIEKITTGFDFDFKKVLTNCLFGEAKYVGTAYACLTIIIFKYRNLFILNRTSQNFIELIIEDTKMNLNKINNYSHEIIDIVKNFLNVILSDKFYNQSFNEICLISGGETTVNLNNSDPKNLGGRNQELTLAFEYSFKQLVKFQEKENLKINCLFSSYGTDGIDGPTDAAGAYFIFDSLHDNDKDSILNEMNSSLLTHNSYSYYQRNSRLLKIGPTGTNVSDVQILLIKF